MLGSTGRPPAADVFLASGLLAGALTEVWLTGTAPGPRGLGSVVAVLSTVPLALRRVRPLAPVAAVVIAILLPATVRPPVEADGLVVLLGWLVAVHAVNAHAARGPAAVGTALVGAALCLTVWVGPPGPGGRGSNIAWGLSMLAISATAGQVLRGVESRHEAERRRAETAAREAERRRIARELHDVVAHGLAVMVVQAGAAQQLVRQDPNRAVTLLDGVQESGSHAAAELRRLLALVGDASHDVLEEPGLAGIGELVDGVRAAGLRVTLTLSVPDAVPPGVERAVYRVVQEGLTNALKHGPRRRADVRVVVVERTLVVDVVDVGSSPAPGSMGGLGLAGLTERVAFHRGTCEAGPVDGDWRLRAALPLEAGPTLTVTGPRGPG